MAFCDQVNKEIEGAQIAVKLLAHKIQSPQERESLYALTVSNLILEYYNNRLHRKVQTTFLLIV